MHITELVADEIEEALAFRNSIFGLISLDHWDAMGCTAVVARDDGRMVGFIPLQYREQCLRPGLSIPVVYENAVGVASDSRSRGIGTKMIDAAAKFMGDRVDALMVIRGGERSDGYRFYRKSGHGDLCYARPYRLEAGRGSFGRSPGAVEAIDTPTWLSHEAGFLALWEEEYGRFGGGRVRTPGYWKTIFDSHVYRERERFLFVHRRGDGAMDGYLFAARGIWDKTPDLFVYEVVAREPSVTAALLARTSDAAAPNALRFIAVSLRDPLRAQLRDIGFEEGESSPHIMCRVLRPDRIFRRLADGSGLDSEVSLTVQTPHRTQQVAAAAASKRRIVLETKEQLLARLFCCRLDLEAAVAMELVRWNCDDPGLARDLYAAFRPADWVQWFSDYV